MRKRGKVIDKGKELGQITDFASKNEEESQQYKNLSSGMYVYIVSKSKFGSIKSKKADNILVLKVRNSNKKDEYDEIEV